jgi:hypothetical protein
MSWTNKTKWEKYIPLVEFSYNNSYHSSIQATPYEVLYGRPCCTPLSWDHLEDRSYWGRTCSKKWKNMVTIKQRLKEARDHQKIYADAKRMIEAIKKVTRFLSESNPLRVPSDLVRELSYPLGLSDHLRTWKGSNQLLISLSCSKSNVRHQE